MYPPNGGNDPLAAFQALALRFRRPGLGPQLRPPMQGPTNTLPNPAPPVMMPSPPPTPPGGEASLPPLAPSPVSTPGGGPRLPRVGQPLDLQTLLASLFGAGPSVGGNGSY